MLLGLILCIILTLRQRAKLGKDLSNFFLNHSAVAGDKRLAGRGGKLMHVKALTGRGYERRASSLIGGLRQSPDTECRAKLHCLALTRSFREKVACYYIEAQLLRRTLTFQNNVLLLSQKEGVVLTKKRKYCWNKGSPFKHWKQGVKIIKKTLSEKIKKIPPTTQRMQILFRQGDEVIGRKIDYSTPRRSEVIRRIQPMGNLGNAHKITSTKWRKQRQREKDQKIEQESGGCNDR
ncbi:hypothetical protein JTE90_008836 [Oedothorax gibbosus]|uniref:Uncharacterized protein n=1 Tax=Oedothorax gibbosus TaxID=931172 RepID=A0AAV6UCL6_9ARAC|nr:hypothetical protein JTE90_008836 [Oedothorax gibbosus]